MDIITRRIIEKYYQIAYEDWPEVGAEAINYLDVVYLLNLRYPLYSMQVSLVFDLLDELGIRVYEIKDLIGICQYIIQQNYHVSSYIFDEENLGIILRRFIIAELNGLRLLPNYRGNGVV